MWDFCINLLINDVKMGELLLLFSECWLTQLIYIGYFRGVTTIIPIDRNIEFVDKYPNENKDKTQLQRFLGCLNYIANYYLNLATDVSILHARLKKNPKPWSSMHTKTVQKIKLRVKQLPCLAIPNPNWEKFVETDASNKGYEGILKQYNPKDQLHCKYL